VCVCLCFFYASLREKFKLQLLKTDSVFFYGEYINQRCPPKNELVYFIFVLFFLRSVDGGKTWSVVLTRVRIDPGSVFETSYTYEVSATLASRSAAPS